MKKEWKVAISGLLALCMTVQPGLSAIPAVQAKETGQVIIDASDYGADPTGASDSTEAIWDALNAAKQAKEDGASSVTVSFPKGEYHIYKDYVPKRENTTHPTQTVSRVRKRPSVS